MFAQFHKLAHNFANYTHTTTTGQLLCAQISATKKEGL